AEILRHLVETGAVTFREGAWRITGPGLRAAGIPEGVREAIRGRLARLGGEGYRALTVAAVIGRELPSDPPARVASLDRETLRAGERAATRLAHEEAAGHYARALEVLALKRPPDRERECELRIALGEAQAKAGDTARARATFEVAAALARRLRSGELLGRAAL